MEVEEDTLDKPCEPSSDNGLGQEELSRELSNAVDFLRLGATPKEMQDLIRVAALGTQYPKDSSSRDMVREFMTIYRSFTYHDGANHKFLGSYDSSDKEKEELSEMGKPVTKGKEKKDKKGKAKQKAEEIEVTGKEENETDKHGKMKKERKRKKSESKKEGGEGEETQKEANESTKKERKRKKSESKKQSDGEEETQKEPSESTKKERKRKNPESKKKAEAVEEEETRKESVESTKKERKRKKPKHDEEEVPNETEKPEKKKKKKREGKSKKKETETEFSGAELYVTFGPGSSLPKKEDLIEIYEKFGALDKERTDTVDNNFSAHVAFLDVADGEKAFESSLEKCPFTSNSTVKFRLKYPNERTEEKKTEAEVAETTMEVEYLKKKLDEMKLLLDGCEGGMTEEVKVKLEGEMVNLLEKVIEMRSS
jgi:myosin heavy subunit